MYTCTSEEAAAKLAPTMQALLRRYYGAITALLRLCQGSVKALLRDLDGGRRGAKVCADYCNAASTYRKFNGPDVSGIIRIHFSACLHALQNGR